MNNTPCPEDQCPSEFTSKTPHFFNIILEDSDTKKLRIPKKFVRQYGGEISSSVSLKVPSGEFWKVELTKCDDGTWLDKGWLEFVKHYALSYGSFLLFRYEGNCNFHVIIFDKSATEISYPYSKVHNVMEEDNKDKEVSVAILNENIPPSKKRRGRPPAPSKQPQKKVKFSPNISIRHSIEVKKEILEPNHQFNVDSDKRSGKCQQQTKVSGIKGASAVKEPTDALLLASSFQSKNPFFIIRMSPSYIVDKMCVPVKFCHKYLPKQTCDIMLSVRHRPARSVGFSFSTQPKLCHGWKAFVKENHLEVRDVCVFELINQTTLTFNVLIFQDAKTGLKPEKDGAPGKSGIIRKASRPRKTAASAAQGIPLFKSENPFVQITTHRSCSQYVAMPYFFIKENITRDVINLTVEDGGEVWPVKVLLYTGKKVAHMGGGWPAFVRGNSVKAGEVCAFELINKEDALLRVHFLSRYAK